MNIGCCKCCKKVIKYDDISLCDDCKEIYKQRVKAYLRENGIKTAQEIKAGTKVPISVIEYFLKKDVLYDISEEELRKNLYEQERLRKLALLNSLKATFTHKDDIDEESEYKLKGEMHYLGGDKRR